MPTISQLTPVTTPATTDVFPSQQVGGATVSQTPAQIVSTQRNVPNGVAGTDSANTISGQTVLATGGTTARTLAAMAADAPYIEDFGGGVGVADNAPALLAALAVTSTVRFHTGTYKFGAITINNGTFNQVALIGVADGSTVFLAATGASTSWFTLNVNQFIGDNIQFQCTTPGLVVANAISISSYASNTMFNNCSVVNNVIATGCGIFYNSTGLPNGQHLFTGGGAYSCSNHGILIEGSGGIIIEDAVFSNNTNAGIHMGMDASNNPSQNIIICRCTFDSNGQGIGTDAPEIPGTTNYSWTVPHVLYLTVQDNIVYNSTNYNIYVAGVQNGLIVNNTCYFLTSGTAAQSYGASILGDCCSFTVFSGNNISGNSYFGMDIASTNLCTISNNIFTGCTVSLNCGGANELVVRGNTMSGFIGWGIGLQFVEGSGAGAVFDGTQKNSVIDGNHINYSSAANAIQIIDNCLNTAVSNNTFISNSDAYALNAVKNISNSTKFSNNYADQETYNIFLSTNNIVLPDFITNAVYNVHNPNLTLNTIALNTPANVVGATGIGYISVTAGGSGYPSGSATVTVNFTGGGGTGAAATAFVYNGVIIAIRMTAFGSGYTTAPTISFTASSGSGAAATAKVGLDINPLTEMRTSCIGYPIYISAFSNYTSPYLLSVSTAVSSYFTAGNALIGPEITTPVSSGSTPTTGATVTIPNNVKTYYIRGTGTLASLTIDLPTAPVDNQDLVIVFQIAVTSLTITAAAGYTTNLATSGVPITAGSRVIYNLDGTVWC